MRLGIDIGSTTVKLILLDQEDHIRNSRYERHMSNVFETVVDLLKKMYEELGDVKLRPVITGSGGLSLANLLGIPFEQEVITCSVAVETLIPQTDVAIELGRRRREDHVLRADDRAEDERDLRRAVPVRSSTRWRLCSTPMLLGLNEAAKEAHDDLSDRGTVRCLCEDGHSAADQ